MTEIPTLTVRARLRWWVYPYLHAMAIFCVLMGTRPDFMKVGAFIALHGIKLDVVTTQ